VIAMELHKLDEVKVKGKRVLVRVDFNVPLTSDGEVADDTRINAAIPTITHLMKNGAKIILVSHLGRPKGQRKPELSLVPVAKRLANILRKEVLFVPDVIGEEVEMAVSSLEEGDVLMLENVRFYPEEEKNDPEFARKLASLGDIFVSDAFSVAHRAHASNVGVAQYLKAYAGFLMIKEIENLGMLLDPSDELRPYYVIMGGAKVSDKIGVIDNILDKVDGLFIGGGMVFTFLKAKGYEIGRSLLEEDYIEYAKEVMKKAEETGKKIVLPTDIVVADSIDADTGEVVPVDAIPADKMGLDIGPESIELFKKELADGKLVFWNGPMGVFEKDAFAEGTKAIAEYLAQKCEKGEMKVVLGGGDSAAAAHKFGVADKYTHVSTGGGASLKFLEGKTLPGIQVLYW